MSYSQLLPLSSSDDEIGALWADEIQIRIFCSELMRSQDETGGQGEYVLHVGWIFACGMWIFGVQKADCGKQKIAP